MFRNSQLSILNSAFRLSGGQALIELLVAFGIFGLFSVAVTTLSIDALWSIQTGPEYTAASAYAQEGVEAARQVADRTWTALTLGDHGVTVETVDSETRYAFTASSDTRGIYTRVVQIAEVRRDGSGNIVEQGGTVDPDTRRVTSTVTWQTGVTRRQAQATLTTLLTNWESFSWTETLKQEFEQGVLTDTEAIPAPTPPTGNGSVRLRSLSAGGAFRISGTVSGPADGRDLAVSGGYTYLVTTLGAGVSSFFVIDTSRVESPQQVAELELGAKLYAIALSGIYAFVATDDNHEELKVVDIANPRDPRQVGSYNVPNSNVKALSVAVDGSRLYLGMEQNDDRPAVQVFSIATDPRNPVLLGSLSLPQEADIRGLAPVGNRLYAATSDDDAEVRTIDVSNPAAPSLVASGTENLQGTSDATSIAVSGTRMFLTRTGENQLVILNLDNPDNPDPAGPGAGSVELGGKANDVAVSGAFAYVATDASVAEFQRVRISTLAVDATVDLAGEGRAIAVSGTCAHLATNASQQKLVIVCGTGGTQSLSQIGAYNADGSGNGRSVAFSGSIAYLGTESGVLHAVDMTNPALPVLLGSLTLQGSVEDIALDGSYAYLATADPGRELAIVNISNPAAMNVVGVHNAALPGLSVAVSGTRVYLSVGSLTNSTGDLLVLDVSTPTTPTVVGQAHFGAAPTEIGVARNILYVSLTRQGQSEEPLDTAEIQRVIVSGTGIPTRDAVYNAQGEDNGKSVTVSGEYIYLGTGEKSGAQPEFYILRYAQGTLNLAETGSALNIGGAVNAIVQHDLFAFTATGRSGYEFSVLDISTIASPFIRNNLSLEAAANDLAVSGTYAYVASDHDEKELIILHGIIDSAGSAGWGTAESIAFDAAQDRLWEQLGWTATLNGGMFRFQVRWATPTGTSTCAQALTPLPYVGPQGNSAAFYTTSPSVLTMDATDQSPTGRCFQWRATITGTGGASPQLHDVTTLFR